MTTERDRALVEAGSRSIPSSAVGDERARYVEAAIDLVDRMHPASLPAAAGGERAEWVKALLAEFAPGASEADALRMAAALDAVGPTPRERPTFSRIADEKRKTAGSCASPGFKAYASDFSEGTRLVITAQIEPRS